MSANTSTSTDSQSVECEVCGKTVSRSGALGRHMKIHSKDKGKMLYRCSWSGCTFTTLQKSNFETHLNTHTKTKNKECPDCDFKCVDPGSLTRHRKKRHAYTPKSRKPRGVGSEPQSSTSAATSVPTKPARRPTPYTRPVLPKTAVADGVLRESEYTSMVCSTKVAQDEIIPDLYFWLSGGEQSSPSPKALHPAVDTGRHMEDGFSGEASVYNQPAHMNLDQIDGWNLTASLIMQNDQWSSVDPPTTAGMPHEQGNIASSVPLLDPGLGSMDSYQLPQQDSILTEASISYWSAMQLPPFEQQASLPSDFELSRAPWTTPSECIGYSYASTTGYLQGAPEYPPFMGSASSHSGFVMLQADQSAAVSSLPSYNMSN